MTDAIAIAAEVLQGHGTILYPTDTIWGIGADATNEEAVAKIYHIKQRVPDKSFIILLPDLRSISRYVTQMPLHIEDIYDSFTEPTTVIYPSAIHLADNAVNADGSVAIRIPDDVFCKRLLKKLGRPIVSTSANISGEPFPRIFSEISVEVRDAVDFVVPYRQDDDIIRNPSRIIRILDDGTLEYIR